MARVRAGCADGASSWAAVGHGPGVLLLVAAHCAIWPEELREPSMRACRSRVKLACPQPDPRDSCFEASDRM